MSADRCAREGAVRIADRFRYLQYSSVQYCSRMTTVDLSLEFPFVLCFMFKRRVRRGRRHTRGRDTRGLFIKYFHRIGSRHRHTTRAPKRELGTLYRDQSSTRQLYELRPTELAATVRELVQVHLYDNLSL